MASNCFSQYELREFLLGELPEEVSLVIDQHLQECDDCEDTVAGLDLECDTLIVSLKGAEAIVGGNNGVDEFELSPSFQNAIGKAKNLATVLGLDDEDFKQEPIEDPRQGTTAGAPKTIGQYEIVGQLGSGGMGSVFRARHSQLEKEVAIKILPTRKMFNSDAIARFTREMKLIGKMDHPVMVSATDAGKSDGVHFLVMELVDGLDLAKVVRAAGPLTVADSCELVRQAALGLQYAHEQGVVHRDVKPSNLMLNREGRVKVLDLGLATLSELTGAEDQLTTVGQLMGTLDYMAPEQIGNHRQADARSDVYGLGATLYRMLTGRSPYSSPENDSPLKKIHAMASSEGVPVLKRAPNLPGSLAEIVQRCLERDPDKRFASAAEVAGLLEGFCEGNQLGLLLEQSQSNVLKQPMAPSNSEVEFEFDRAASQLNNHFKNQKSDPESPSKSVGTQAQGRSWFPNSFALPPRL